MPRKARLSPSGAFYHIMARGIAEKVIHAAGITERELLKRSRGNRRLDVRRFFAYICHREYGIPIMEIARYLGISHSPASLVVKKGEELSEDKKYAKVLLVLRP